jgi:hypothetical protein
LVAANIKPIESYLPAEPPAPWVRGGVATPPGGANYVIPGQAGLVITARNGQLLCSFSGYFPMTDEFCLGKFFPERKFAHIQVPAGARARYYSEVVKV